MLKYNDETCEITFNDKVIATWNDEANCNYPEDLIWMREISGLCDSIFKAGIEEGERRLRAENARYREALQAYADLADGDWYGPDDRYYNIGDTAREALKGE